MFQKPALALVTAALGLGALAPAAGRLSFAPKEGAALVKTFETRLHLALEDMLVELNGEEMDPRQMAEGIDFENAVIDVTLNVGVNDTYVALGEGRPLELLREFQDLRFAYEDGFGNSEEKEDEADLVGHTVRFKWNDDSESYDASFEGDAGDADALETLSEDMDLRAFLPADNVEEGAQWKIAWKDNLSLVLPGIDFGKLDTADLDVDEDEMPREVLEALLGQLRGVFSGAEATLTYKGARHVDGRELGVVAISSTIEGTLDFLSVMQAAPDVPEEVDFESFDLDLGVELQGELLWDLAGGHFRSLELTGDVVAELTLDMAVDQQGMALDIHATVEFAGDLARSASVK